MRARSVFLVMGLGLFCGCNREASASNDPQPGVAASQSAFKPSPWEPVDESFRGCEGG